MSDALGVDLTEFQFDLEVASCLLIDNIPSAYQSSMKVYDFSFYALNEYKQEEIGDSWIQFLNSIDDNSQYYIAFGRSFSNQGSLAKFHVSIKLPPLEGPNCITDEEIIYLNSYALGVLNNELSPTLFALKEIELLEHIIERLNCREICDNGIDDDQDGWIDCNDSDCGENKGVEKKEACIGQAVFRENIDQIFGFDDNKIKAYPTYQTIAGEGVPWKSLGIGVEDVVDVEFSDGVILSEVSYHGTGVIITAGVPNPDNERETIRIIGNSLTSDGRVDVKDGDGNILGSLMIKVLPERNMIMNIILLKLPSDADYVELNFTTGELRTVMNSCFKQINTSWTINEADKYEYDFDTNTDGSLTRPEDYYFLLTHLKNNYVDLFNNRYIPQDSDLNKKTSTYFFYPKTLGENGDTKGGWTYTGTIYGSINSVNGHNKRSAAHENGHRLGYQHPFSEFSSNVYTPFSDGPSLMEYVDFLTGFKIRAYQW